MKAKKTFSSFFVFSRVLQCFDNKHFWPFGKCENRWWRFRVFRIKHKRKLLKWNKRNISCSGDRKKAFCTRWKYYCSVFGFNWREHCWFQLFLCNQKWIWCFCQPFFRGWCKRTVFWLRHCVGYYVFGRILRKGKSSAQQGTCDRAA